jgi:hypothetical protein
MPLTIPAFLGLEQLFAKMRIAAMTQETVKFWQVPEADDLELLRATYIRHSFARHTHDTFAVGVIQQGTEVFAYGGATHRAPMVARR